MMRKRIICYEASFWRSLQDAMLHVLLVIGFTIGSFNLKAEATDFNSSQLLFSGQDETLLTATCPMGVRPSEYMEKESIHLRALVVVKHPPLGILDESIMNTTAAAENFDPNFPPSIQGYMPDAMREIQRLAMELDNVTLKFQVDAVPLSFKDNTFGTTLNMVAIDCNETTNPMPIEDCQRYDLLVGSYWPSPKDRSLVTSYSPPLVETGYVTVRYVPDEDDNNTTKIAKRGGQRPVDSLAFAQALNATVCLRSGDNSVKDNLATLYPNLHVAQRCDNHDECLELIKNPQEDCALYVGHELTLRYISAKRGNLAVNYEYALPQQIISWAFNSRLDPKIQMYLQRHIYKAKQSGFLGQLYNQYFNPSFCPLGKAGVDCELPCHPAHGVSDRKGRCICDSTRWTGEDCSVEVMEDTNLIPPGSKIASYVFIAINFCAVAICAIWLYANQKMPQVEVAQPIFLGLVLLGCLISTSTIFALAQEDAGDGPVAACMVTPWLYSVGFCITFGTLYAKIRRVYAIFQAAEQMQRITVTKTETLMVVGGILLIDVTILTVWTILDPLEWVRIVTSADEYGHTLSSVGYCTSNHWEVFVSCIALFHFLLMFVACCKCYAARNLPTLFFEGKYLALAMASNLQIYVVAVPILILLGSESQTSFFVRSVAIWMNDLVVLLFIFGNLMRSVYDGENGQNKAQLVSSALRSFRQQRRSIINSKGSGSRSEEISSSRINCGNTREFAYCSSNGAQSTEMGFPNVESPLNMNGTVKRMAPVSSSRSGPSSSSVPSGSS